MWLQPRQLDQVFGQLSDLDRLTHVKEVNSPGCRHGSGLQHQLDGLRDGHEVTRHVLVGHLHGTTILDLPLEARDYAAPASEYVAETHTHEVAGAVSSRT